jgi:Skp family chaperone for outer membrane proteins
MKNRFVLLVIIILILPTIAWAKHSNIAIIDIDKAINESMVYISLQSTLEKQNLKYQQELKGYETKIMALDKEIGQNSNKLSQEQLKKLKTELSQSEIEAQKVIHEHRISLDNAFSKAIEKIKISLFDIISNIAKEQNIQLVLPKSQTLYNTNSIDITNQVLQALNNKLKTVDVRFKELKND